MTATHTENQSCGTIQNSTRPTSTEPASDTQADTQAMTTSLSGQPTVEALALRVVEMETTTAKEEVLDLREILAFMAGQMKELRERLDEKLIDWIDANGAIQVGSRRIYVGTKKDTKCRALKPALQALMESSGGDWEQFCACLSSNAIKYGAAKTVMTPDVWATHFEVVEKTELKEDGKEKPIRQIVDLDETFLKRK